VIRTPRRLALATGSPLLAGLLLLTGCGEGELRPGAAAIVGEERITTEELQQIVDRGLADPQAAQQLGSDLEAYQRLTLSRLINRAILAHAAEQEGVSVTEGDVDEQIELFVQQAGSRESLDEQAAQSGIAPPDLKPFVRDIVLDQALGDALTEDEDVPADRLNELYQENIAQYDRVRARHILVPEEETARTILQNVTRDPSRFPALAEQFSTDTSNKDNGGDLGFAGRGMYVPEFEQAIFNAEPGEPVVVQTQFGWHVVEVLERDTTTLQEATPDLRRQALQVERQAAVQEALQSTAEELGVTVNPRFGRWNGDTGQVEPEDSPNGVITPAPEGGVQPDGPPGQDPGQAPPAEEPVEEPAEEPAEAPVEEPVEEPAG
jgi:parvulin-like peptidyl-prolyl isomerase